MIPLCYSHKPRHVLGSSFDLCTPSRKQIYFSLLIVLLLARHFIFITPRKYLDNVKKNCEIINRQVIKHSILAVMIIELCISYGPSTETLKVQQPSELYFAFISFVGFLITLTKTQSLQLFSLIIVQQNWPFSRPDTMFRKAKPRRTLNVKGNEQKSLFPEGPGINCVLYVDYSKKQNVFYDISRSFWICV